jgi:hypothetical protein
MSVSGTKRTSNQRPAMSALWGKADMTRKRRHFRHHRQLHYGGIDVTITETAFEFVVAETLVTIPKLVIPVEVPAAQVHQAAI